MSEFVTEERCKERREACHNACSEARETRDAWIEKLEKKIDNLINLAIVQLCALVLTLLGVLILK